jgi:hypothetical protein
MSAGRCGTVWQCGEAWQGTARARRYAPVIRAVNTAQKGYDEA